MFNRYIENVMYIFMFINANAVFMFMESVIAEVNYIRRLHCKWVSVESNAVT